MDKEEKIILKKRNQRAEHDRCNVKTCFLFYFFEAITMAVVNLILFDRLKADEKAHTQFRNKYTSTIKSFHENGAVNPRSVLNFQVFPEIHNTC